MRTEPVKRSEIRMRFVPYRFERIIALPKDACHVGDGMTRPIDELFIPVFQQLQKEFPPSMFSPGFTSEIGFIKKWRKCGECGADFYTVKLDTDDRPTWMCSDACAEVRAKRAAEKTRKFHTERRSAERAKRRADLKCRQCGEPIEAVRSTARFCSAKCRVTAHRRG